MADVRHLLTGGLKADDIGELGEKISLTVRDVEVRTFPNEDGGEDTKLKLAFEETGKVLFLNSTNLNKMVATFGGDSDDWIGKEITLRVALTSYQGKECNGIRIV